MGLGAEVLDIDVEEIPNESTIVRLDKYVEELKLLKESRENEVFSIKERIVELTDILDYDMNNTALSFTLEFDALAESLKDADLKAYQDVLFNLENRLKDRKHEAMTLFDQICNLYSRLSVG